MYIRSQTRRAKLAPRDQLASDAMNQRKRSSTSPPESPLKRMRISMDPVTPQQWYNDNMYSLQHIAEKYDKRAITLIRSLCYANATSISRYRGGGYVSHTTAEQMRVIAMMNALSAILRTPDWELSGCERLAGLRS